ncbi:helix-turn-helix domain-containing protein [Sinirhodobacter populi]|uniref:Helix-turn-helix domain-containing protein n=1 Tax=Paenirhodobacter populi TaxID=2306993 RepID=A0A443JZE9_9RHOB|nr:helix-turn-helix domain-containing protein [Sinirhodobacter populi]
MAAEAHVSPRSIQRHIRDATGLAPGEWLLRERLSLASELLEGSSRSIGEIAALCGLGSATNSREHFRAAMGLPPSVYRARFPAGAGQPDERADGPPIRPVPR